MEVKQLPQAIKPRINYRGNYTKWFVQPFTGMELLNTNMIENG